MERESSTQGMTQTFDGIGAQEAIPTIVKTIKTPMCEKITERQKEVENPELKRNPSKKAQSKLKVEAMGAPSTT